MIQRVQQTRTQLQALRQSNNPTAMMQTMLMSNPQLKQAADLVNNTYHGDGKAAFYDAARAKGMNDQQIEDFLKALQ